MEAPIEILKVEHNVVTKELARFRVCDPDTRCYFCREWAQYIYKKYFVWNKAPPEPHLAPEPGFLTAGRYRINLANSKQPTKVRSTKMFDSFKKVLEDPAVDAQSSLTDDIIAKCNEWITMPSSLTELPSMFDKIELESFEEEFNKVEDAKEPAKLLEPLNVSRLNITLPASEFHLLKNLTGDILLSHKEATCDHIRPEWKSPSDLEIDTLVHNSRTHDITTQALKEIEKALDEAWSRLTTFLEQLRALEDERTVLMGKDCRASIEEFAAKQSIVPFQDYWTGRFGDYKKKKQSLELDTVDEAFASYFDKLVECATAFQTDFVIPRLEAVCALVQKLWDLVVPTIQQMADRMASYENKNENYLKNCYALSKSLQDLHPTADVRFAVDTIQLETAMRVKEFAEEVKELKRAYKEESRPNVVGRFEKVNHKVFKKQLKRVENGYSGIRHHFRYQLMQKIFPETLFAKFSLICIEALMQEGELMEVVSIEREVKRFMEANEELVEERQFLLEDFEEGIQTGRTELAGVIGRLLLKEGMRIQGENLAKQRQNSLLKSLGVPVEDDTQEAPKKKKGKKKKGSSTLPEPIPSPGTSEERTPTATTSTATTTATVATTTPTPSTTVSKTITESPKPKRDASITPTRSQTPTRSAEIADASDKVTPPPLKEIIYPASKETPPSSKKKPVKGPELVGYSKASVAIGVAEPSTPADVPVFQATPKTSSSKDVTQQAVDSSASADSWQTVESKKDSKHRSKHVSAEPVTPVKENTGVMWDPPAHATSPTETKKKTEPTTSGQAAKSANSGWPAPPKGKVSAKESDDAWDPPSNETGWGQTKQPSAWTDKQSFTEVVKKEAPASVAQANQASKASKAPTAPKAESDDSMWDPPSGDNSWGVASTEPVKTKAKEQRGDTWGESTTAESKPAKKAERAMDNDWVRPAAAKDTTQGGWGQPAASKKVDNGGWDEPPATKSSSNDGWGEPAVTKSMGSDGWGEPPATKSSTNEGWGQPTGTKSTGNDGWGEPAVAKNAGSDGWGEPAVTKSSTNEGWGQPTGTKSTGNDGWGEPAVTKNAGSDGWGEPAVTKSSNNRGWDQPATAKESSNDGWGEPTAATEPSSGGWGQRGAANESSNSGWGKPAPSKSQSQGGWGQRAMSNEYESDGWHTTKANASRTNKGPAGLANNKQGKWNQAVPPSGWNGTDRWTTNSAVPDKWNAAGNQSLDRSTSESTSANDARGWSQHTSSPNTPTSETSDWQRKSKGWNNGWTDVGDSTTLPTDSKQASGWGGDADLERRQEEAQVSEPPAINFSLKDLTQRLHVKQPLSRPPGFSSETPATNPALQTVGMVSPLTSTPGALAPMLTPVMDKEVLREMPQEKLISLLQTAQLENMQLVKSTMALQQELAMVSTRYSELMTLSREREAQTLQLFEARKQTEMEEARRYILSLENRISTLESQLKVSPSPSSSSQFLGGGSHRAGNGAIGGFGNQDLFAGYREEMRSNQHRGKRSWNKPVVVRCGNCGGSGHASTECQDVCRYCNGTDHLSEACPHH